MVKGRRPTAQAISVAVGLNSREVPLFRTFEVTDRELAIADGLANELFAHLRTVKQRPTIELAALARLVERLTNETGELV